MLFFGIVLRNDCRVHRISRLSCNSRQLYDSMITPMAGLPAGGMGSRMWGGDCVPCYCCCCVAFLHRCILLPILLLVLLLLLLLRPWNRDLSVANFPSSLKRLFRICFSLGSHTDLPSNGIVHCRSVITLFSLIISVSFAIPFAFPFPFPFPSPLPFPSLPLSLALSLTHFADFNPPPPGHSFPTPSPFPYPLPSPHISHRSLLSFLHFCFFSFFFFFFSLPSPSLSSFTRLFSNPVVQRPSSLGRPLSLLAPPSPSSPSRS